MCQIDVKPEFTGQLKKCSCCGKELPLSHFGKYASGYRKICNDCREENLVLQIGLKTLRVANLLLNLKLEVTRVHFKRK